MLIIAEQERNWAQRRESGTLWQLRLLRWIGLRAPTTVVSAVLWLVAFVYAANRSRQPTKASDAYLRRALGRDSGFRARHRHALTFAHVVRDRVRLLAGGVDGFCIEAQNEALIDDAVSAGSGAVLLGAHFGSFEALRAFERRLPGLRVRYLMFPEHAPHTTTLLRDINPEVASRVIPLTDGLAAMLEVHAALEQGDFVAFLGDRLPDPSVRAKIAVPFLGGEIWVPTSPYASAMAAGVPLIMCFAPRLGKDRYAVEFERIYDGEPVPRKERDAEIARLAHLYAARLESLCRRYPYNWFNFFNIWRE